MSACCSSFERAADQQFNEKKAAEELERYRTKGPGPTTHLLQEGIAHAGALNATLLDVGSGVGSLTLSSVLTSLGLQHRIGDDECPEISSTTTATNLNTSRDYKHRLTPMARSRILEGC